MHLSFLKLKKKKKWNGIVAMALPNSIPLFIIPKVFFYFPISAMPLPQLQKIYTLYFGNAIAANYFFFPPIFGNGIATIAKKKIFPSFGFPCAHSHFEHPFGQQVWAEGIATIPLLKIKNFSLLLFIFLSPTFVEFRQWYCCNSLSFLSLLNKLKQYR